MCRTGEVPQHASAQHGDETSSFTEVNSSQAWPVEQLQDRLWFRKHRILKVSELQFFLGCRHPLGDAESDPHGSECVGRRSSLFGCRVSTQVVESRLCSRKDCDAEADHHDTESSFYHQLWINTWRSKFEQERETVFFLLVDPRDKSHKDLEKIDLSVPRRAQHLHNAWKRHQDAVFWVDINLAIRKGLTFYQTRSNAIILQGILPAYCIPKVVRLEKSYTKKYTCHLGFHQRSL